MNGGLHYSCYDCSVTAKVVFCVTPNSSLTPPPLEADAAKGVKRKRDPEDEDDDDDEEDDD